MDGKCLKNIRSLLPCVIIGFFSSSNMTGVGSADSDKDSTILRSTKEIIRDFGNYTTSHGVGRLAEAKTIFSRLIWTIFILGAFSMFIYQTRGLFQLYLSRPVSTLVQVRHATVS